jgi:hypothetical protein
MFRTITFALVAAAAAVSTCGIQRASPKPRRKPEHCAASLHSAVRGGVGRFVGQPGRYARPFSQRCYWQRYLCPVGPCQP